MTWSRTIAPLAAALLAGTLATPVAAHAASTLSVENGAIRYVGDDGANELQVFPAVNGEQDLDSGDATTGPGCRKRDPSSNDQQRSYGNILCTLSGVDRIEFVGGGGPDHFSDNGGELPVRADMGAGDDRFEIGSPLSDDVQLGDGNDVAIDGPGDDRIDGGPGDDTVSGVEGLPGAAATTGNDTILGGEGNDNLDGKDGNDTVDGGPGNDLFQPSPGDDTLTGDAGDDDMCASGPMADFGNDRMSGGPGNDVLCGGPGVDTLDGGEGNDGINSIDSDVDAPVACGPGTDSVWADAFDVVGLDCEQQGQDRTVSVPTPFVVPVSIPCAPGACSGTVTLFAAPGAPHPVPEVAPATTPTLTAGKALARKKFKLRANQRRALRLRLDKRAAKRLKRLGATTVEARTTFMQGGHRYTVGRTFGVAKR